MKNEISMTLIFSANKRGNDVIIILRQGHTDP